MIRNTMTRLHAEISRSISFYRAQQHGAAPQRVLLCGGSVSLPYMREFFHEKLQLPVDFFNPLRNVTIGAGLNVEELAKQAHTLGEPVGLALRSVLSCPMEMNLRPASVVRAHRIAEQRPYFILAGICLWLALAAFWLYYDRAAAVTESVVQNMDPKVQKLKGFEGKINSVRGEMKKQEELADPFLKAVRDREAWTKIIEDINGRLPKDYVWITHFSLEEKKEAPGAPVKPGAKPDKTEKVEKTTYLVRGLYLDNPQGTSVVDAFVEALDASPLYEVNKDETVFKRSVANDTDWAYDFAFPLILKSATPEGGKTKGKAK
jgi:hypothetical protein